MSLKIKEVLKFYNVSQKEVAEKTGISVQSLSYYNSGEKKPPLEKIKLIADAIGCNYIELLEPGDDYGHFYVNKEWEGIRKK